MKKFLLLFILTTIYCNISKLSKSKIKSIYRILNKDNKIINSDLNINNKNISYSQSYIKRFLNEGENSGKNNVTNNVNNNKNNQNTNSGIGWLGVLIIIILSIVVLYVLYVGFRYYRRKKYQNPSFYYKITEEMFEDITPIE